MSQETEGEGLSFNLEEFSLSEILKPQHTALLVIDMQNDFLHSEGFFTKSPTVPGVVDQMHSIIPKINKLTEVARNAGVPVIFTKGYEDVKFRKGPDLRRAVNWHENDSDGSVNSQSGTWGSEISDEVDIKPGDLLIEKHKWSSFSGKDALGRSLKEILDQLGVRTLVITGVVAETCIETTIREAYDRDYFVVVARNSVGSNQPEQLEVRMKYWEAGFIGDVLNEQEIEEYWPSAPNN